MKKVTLTALTAALSLSLMAAAQTAPATPAKHAARLVIADGKTGTLTVLDTEKGAVMGTFGTPGKLSGLYVGPGGQYVYGIHRDSDRVTVLNSGLSSVSHGDHNDLVVGVPYVLATLNVGPKPTHFFSHVDRIVIFNDGDGSMPIFGEELLGKTNDMQVIKAAKPDHGAPALLGNTLLAGMLSLNRIDAFDVGSGKLLRSIEDCPGVHGESIRGDTAYFGCTDGVLALTVKGSDITSRKLSNPASTPEKTRVGTVVTHEKSSVMFGNFGSGLASWKAASTTLKPLPLSAAPLNFTFTEDGQTLVVLTANGELHTLNPATGKVKRSAAVVPAYDASNKEALRPALTLGDDVAYVASPGTGEILTVNLADLKVTSRLKVAGQPALIALVEADGMQH